MVVVVSVVVDSKEKTVTITAEKDVTITSSDGKLKLSGKGVEIESSDAVKVHASGDQLNFSVNGIEVAALRDDALAVGRVGVFVGGDGNQVDLDWFTAEALDPLYLAQNLRQQGIPFVTRQVAPGTLHGSVFGIRVSLLEYRYPLLNRLRSWRHSGLPVLASKARSAAEPSWSKLT